MQQEPKLARFGHDSFKTSRRGIMPAPGSPRTTFVVKQVGEPTVPKLNLQAGEQLMPVVVATRGAFIRAK